MNIQSAYLAHPDFENELEDELGKGFVKKERWYFSDKPPINSVWAQDIWLDPQLIPIASISDAVKKLRALGLHWHLHSIDHHRRAALIQAELPKLKNPLVIFPDIPTIKAAGGWMLWDKDTLLASPHRSHLYPDGLIPFVEDKETPPNRAYLKLWEALTLLAKRPQQGEICLDLGSSPGGWTWVLQTLGAQVISVDKAPLDSKIAKLPNIQFFQESAFGIDPKRFGKIDWLCCDVACYPERLYEMVQKWLEAGTCKNFVCTIKLQGKTDWAMLNKFRALKKTKVIHLYHNKHELTLFINMNEY
ncbi:hypothetical protein K1X76_09475 [bacterium]|nr:hypothetical protein [bacterium]